MQGKESAVIRGGLLLSENLLVYLKMVGEQDRPHEIFEESDDL